MYIALPIHKKSGFIAWTIIDSEDLDKVKNMYISMTSGGYAVSQLNGKQTYIHHVILKQKHGFIIDHKNGNRLDNRKENLRYLTFLNHAQNKHNSSNNTSGYRNVLFDKRNLKWRIEINSHKKRYVKYYKTKNEAIEAVIKSRQVIQPFFNLNNFNLNILFFDIIFYWRETWYPSCSKEECIIPLFKNNKIFTHTKINSIDCEKIKHIKWRFLNGYAVGTGKNIRLSRIILNMKSDDKRYADHINRDKLDNRRENLRILTPLESAQNRLNKRGNKPIGVCWDKRRKKWRAYAKYANRYYNLGYFDDINIAIEISKKFRLDINKMSQDNFN